MRTRTLSPARQEKADKALIIAAGTGDARGVSRLLRIGASVNAQDISYVIGEEMIETPLSAACTNGHADVVRVLLAEKNINLEEGGRELWTAFITVAQFGHAAIVPLLKEAGANINVQEGYFSHTPLMKASRLGHAETVRALIAAGADRTLVDKSGMQAQDMICHQISCPNDVLASLRGKIANMFADADRRDAQAAEDKKAHARALENISVLQRDIAPAKPLRLKPSKR